MGNYLLKIYVHMLCSETSGYGDVHYIDWLLKMCNIFLELTVATYERTGANYSS